MEDFPVSFCYLFYTLYDLNPFKFIVISLQDQSVVYFSNDSAGTWRVDFTDSAFLSVFWPPVHPGGEGGRARCPEYQARGNVWHATPDKWASPAFLITDTRIGGEGRPAPRGVALGGERTTGRGRRPGGNGRGGESDGLVWIVLQAGREVQPSRMQARGFVWPCS